MSALVWNVRPRIKRQDFGDGETRHVMYCNFVVPALNITKPAGVAVGIKGPLDAAVLLRVTEALIDKIADVLDGTSQGQVDGTEIEYLR